MILLVDSIFMGLYLLIAVMFYPTKNICDSTGLQCYGYFCTGFIIIFTINNAINLHIFKKNNQKNFWWGKIALLVIPITIILLN